MELKWTMLHPKATMAMLGAIPRMLDGADPRSGDSTFTVAVAVAVVLFLLSGPAAYVVSRRRALLAAPAGLLRTWNADPRRSADQPLGRVAETKERLTTPDPDEALASRGEQADPNRQRKLPERRIENAAQRSTNVPR